MADPIHQFQIVNYFSLGKIGSVNLAFTNSALYKFIADTIRNTVGEGGMQFFPLVFSLFMFILVSNMVGLIPYNFTVVSHLIVTVALALLVFFTVVVYGFWK